MEEPRVSFLRELGARLKKQVPGSDHDLEAASPEELRTILERALRSKQPSDYDERNPHSYSKWLRAELNLLSSLALGHVEVTVDAYRGPAFTDDGNLAVSSDDARDEPTADFGEGAHVVVNRTAS